MSNEETVRRLIRILEFHRRELAEAGADKDLIETYAAVIGLAKRQKPADFPGPLKGRKRSNNIAMLSQSELVNLSLDEIERIVNDENSPRKLLEAVAVFRFHVPRGSMRSYSNMRTLREKILTSATNERAHETIKLVARKSEG